MEVSRKFQLLVNTQCSPARDRFKAKSSYIGKTAPILLSALLTACGGDNGTLQSTSTTNPPIQPTTPTGGDNTNGGGLDTSTDTGGSENVATDTDPLSPLLTGVFLDSPVSNLAFETETVSGRTNELGEFSFRDGEQITFFIGGIVLPTVTADTIITPLDIFSTDDISNSSVTNLSRLLQTLDVDGEPDNGIVLNASSHDIPYGTQLVFSDNALFQQAATASLLGVGIGASLVDNGRALTHLANSLISNNIVPSSQVQANALQADAIAADLKDTDIDGVADIFDPDDDGDQVPDYIDKFPLNAAEAFDFDGDGIGDNADTDDDNDGYTDDLDAFPLIASEYADTDGDGYGNNLDTDDDNDGAPDLIDLFPLSADEYADTDNDGIGNNADNDDDNDGTVDSQDVFSLIATESQDSDQDGLGDNADQDDDNDGVPDLFDAFPLIQAEQFDTDGDGVGNNADNDDDNDGIEDSLDVFPLTFAETSDNDNDGIGDNFDLDDDNDGALDHLDAFPNDPLEQLDTDRDGIGNNADTDDDGDGVDDVQDSNPLTSGSGADLDGDGFVDDIDDDNDNDGVPDFFDKFPNDPLESADNDLDGIGDNADLDDDNDLVEDLLDDLPFDPSEQIDTDGDGLGDNHDPDDDNDGTIDTHDAFPTDPTETTDTDLDGIGNNTDTDDDDDGVLDTADAFPLNPFESADSDGDGIGDNSDYDRDNDGYNDLRDTFPDDPTEWKDTDLDGTGDNADLDDDNDGTPDVTDPYPLEAYYGADTDGDGEEDQWDFDDDDDGVPDYLDLFPKDATETVDFDGDGIGDNGDTDDDNDGVADDTDFAPLNAACSASEDSTGGECTTTVLANASFFTQIGNIAYIANESYSAVARVQLDTGATLPSIEIDSFSSGEVTITSMAYSEAHDRVYIGFSSGVIVYIANGTTQSTYFHTLSASAGSIASAGNYLVVGASNNYVQTVLDASGAIVDSRDRDPLSTDTLWIESTSRLIYFDYGDLQSNLIDQTTGAITASTAAPYFADYRNIPPLILSPDGQTIVTGSGTMYTTETLEWIGTATSEDMIDFQWLDSDGLVALHAAGESTRLDRYNTDDLTRIETVTLDGTPQRVFYESGIYYVLTIHEGSLQVHQFVPSNDSDNDLVLNVNDAFPTDPSASVDSDNDGMPDQWNSGYTEADSNSGLMLDAYPDDPACHLAADGDGTQCNYAILIPPTEPDQLLADGSGMVYMLYKDANLVYRWDANTSTYVAPIYVGSSDPVLSTTPDHMIYSSTHNRLYFTYAQGLATFIALDDIGTGEQFFAAVPESILGIASAGDHIMLIDSSGAWVTHYYFDQNGTLTQSEDWNQQSGYFAWNDVTRRLYFFRDSTSPNDLHYEEISAEGLIISDGESPYHGDYRITGPILITPDNTKVLLGAGDYYDATSIDRLGSITREFTHGVFLADGRLAVLASTTTGTELAYYDTTLAPLAGTTDFTGEAIGVFVVNGDIVVLTYSVLGGVEITTIAGG